MLAALSTTAANHCECMRAYGMMAMAVLREDICLLPGRVLRTRPVAANFARHACPRFASSDGVSVRTFGSWLEVFGSFDVFCRRSCKFSSFRMKR